MSNIRQIMLPAEVAITIASKHNCTMLSQNKIRANIFILYYLIEYKVQLEFVVL